MRALAQQALLVLSVYSLTSCTYRKVSPLAYDYLDVGAEPLREKALQLERQKQASHGELLELQGQVEEVKKEASEQRAKVLVSLAKEVAKVAPQPEAVSRESFEESIVKELEKLRTADLVEAISSTTVDPRLEAIPSIDNEDLRKTMGNILHGEDSKAAQGLELKLESLQLTLDADRAAHEELRAEHEKVRLAAAEVAGAKKDGVIGFEDELYFSFEPLVAFDSDLEATAIPAIGVNWRPWTKTALAVSGVFGGALNPSEDGGGGGVAIGLGVAHPVGTKGSVTIGHIWWREDDGGENGFYVGLILGVDGKDSKDGSK